MSLRDLGLSEIRVNQLDDLVSRLLPIPGPEAPPAFPSIWRTSYVSADSFFHNKHGEPLRPLSWKTNQLYGFLKNWPKTNYQKLSYLEYYQKLISCKAKQTFCTFFLTGFSHRRLVGSPIFHRQYHSPLQEVCSQLQFLPGKTPSLNT